MAFSITTILECPGCSKSISFTSGETNIVVCPSCWSVLFRQSDQIVVTKPIPVIQKKTDFIQPGTIGKWGDKSFKVLGRFTVWFDESVFNYWTIALSNHEIAFLGEGYGLFSILKPVQLTSHIDSAGIEKLKTGSRIKLQTGGEFIVDKKQKTIRYEIEGELLLPQVTPNFTVCDFSAPGDKKFTLFNFQKDDIYLFETDYVTLASLQLQNLRSAILEGKSFSCAQCRNIIHVKTFPYSQCCGCQNCGSYYSLNEAMDFKKTRNASTKELPCLAIGSSGKINDVLYEVIGYTQKEEQNIYHSKWREYTLFNQQEGFAFLSEYDGHWIFLRESCNSPAIANENEKELVFDNYSFQLFNSYSYEVINARGEFPYNIFDNQKTKCREFIAPPYIWIQERDSKEGIRWFSGNHISSSEVEKAFSIAEMPPKTGVGAVQPGSISRSIFFKTVAVGFLFILAAYFLTTIGKKETVLMSKSFPFTDTSNTVTYITEKYQLDKRRSNLKLSISAAVSNSWFEVGATLVNATTGKEYSLEKGVEYYYGYSDGESWSEGSINQDAYFTRIPAGTYFLQLQGTRESGITINDFFVEITYDVPNDRNLWLSILLFLIWPVCKYFQIRYVEAERWKNSPYSTYNNED